MDILCVASVGKMPYSEGVRKLRYLIFQAAQGVIVGHDVLVIATYLGGYRAHRCSDAVQILVVDSEDNGDVGLAHCSPSC